MSTGFEIEMGRYGKKLVATSSWDDSMAEVMQRGGIKELELNYAKGWKKPESGGISFVSRLGFLEGLEVVDWTIDDVSAIHGLRSLRRLHIETYCKTRIDFSAFPGIEDCALEWRPGARSIFGATTLRRISLNRYKGRDLTEFRLLTRLEFLGLLNAPVEALHGVESLANLNFLGLYNLRRLQTLSGVESLKVLTTLEVNGALSLSGIEPVKGLRLRRFELCDNRDILSLAPLEGMDSLEEFYFHGSTRIVDGDLSVLTRLRNLKRVAFQERRSYTHTKADILGRIRGQA